MLTYGLEQNRLDFMNKNILKVSLCLALLSGCAASEKEDDRYSVVVTNFAAYDMVRAVAGDLVSLNMIIKPGAETHSFEPTPQNIVDISECGLFVYVGGDSDEWVENILDSMDNEISTFRMMDSVDLLEEEIREGMTAEEEHDHSEHEEELDEHVWTSPVNEMVLVNDLCDVLCEKDPANSEAYRKNAQEYTEKLEALDQQFRDIIDQAKRREIIVADRFPFLYFTREYGLDYYAAYPGCSNDTEPSAQTVAFLIDKVREDEIPVVFHIELSNENMCRSISEQTGAACVLLNAVHNVTDEDFKNGVTYIDLMEHNAEVLRQALN